MQVRSLTHRTRYAEAIRLALDTVRELGITVPAADRLPAELDQQFDHLYRWLDQTAVADDRARPEITDPVLLAATGLINAVLVAAFFTDVSVYAWLSLEALRIWLEHGPGRTLVGPASFVAFAAVAVRGDYAAGYQAVRRILEIGESRGWEPETSQARYLFTFLAWCFEPIEDVVPVTQPAREGLIAGGDLATAGYTYHAAAQYLVDCAPSLEIFVPEVETGLAFVRRTGSEQIGQWLGSYRWLAGVLRGESSAAAGPAAPIDRHSDNPVELLYAHLCQAMAAAIFDDRVGLIRHTEAAMPLLPIALGNYLSAVARLLRGLSLAGQAHATDGDERGGLLSELDEVTRWLAERAADAPDNFKHLLRLLEAERAWVVGDFRAAVLAFDAARREAAGRERPWHLALITERAARFYLAHGVDQVGYDLLAQARQEYLAWGAKAKVDQLDWAYPTLRPHSDAIVTTGTIDLLGILSASQALSSETSVEGLHARVVDLLGAMTGATGVHMLLLSHDRQDWLLPRPGSEGSAIPIRGAVHEPAVPLSVLRYTQRTGEPLVVDDATRDDRFARDPYFADLEFCSLLAVPILSRGRLHAVLLVENRLIRGGFTTERLDAVKLIAGQLAVSLDNAEGRAELLSSRARIVAAADEARRRVQRDLHDGAQQRVVTLLVKLKLLAASDVVRGGGIDADLLELLTDAEAALEELRDISRGLHPRVLSRGGLEPALTALAERSSVPVALDMRVAGRLAESVEIAAYYVIAEMLTNAAKHANPSRVEVDVHPLDGALRVCVRDDGAGGANPAGGSGLVGLIDRVDAIGGTLTIDSPQGRGTTLVASLPLGESRASPPEPASA